MSAEAGAGDAAVGRCTEAAEEDAGVPIARGDAHRPDRRGREALCCAPEWRVRQAARREELNRLEELSRARRQQDDGDRGELGQPEVPRDEAACVAGKQCAQSRRGSRRWHVLAVHCGPHGPPAQHSEQKTSPRRRADEKKKRGRHLSMYLRLSTRKMGCHLSMCLRLSTSAAKQRDRGL